METRPLPLHPQSVPALSVVIPCFNEEASLLANTRAITAVLETMNRRWELILVDDGSTDGTLSIMKQLASAEPRIGVVAYGPNRGRGYALRRGFERASGDVVVSTEADLTWGTEIVPRLVAELERRDVDIVVASPYARGGRMQNVPLGRRILSKVGNRALSSTLPVKVTMVSGMTRAYRREVLENIDIEAENKEVHVEILLKAWMLGYRIAEIPAVLSWEKFRKGGTRRRKSLTMRRMVWGHLLFWMLEKPVFVFGIVGSLLVVAGLVGGLYVVYLWATAELNPVRPLIPLVVIAVLGGLQILSFGLVCTLIARLRKDTYRLQQLNRRALRRLDDE